MDQMLQDLEKNISGEQVAEAAANSREIARREAAHYNMIAFDQE
jgi:hypothetical protein